MSDTPAIVVTRKLPVELPDMREFGEIYVWEGNEPMPRDLLGRMLKQCLGLLCMITETVDAELLDLAPRLRSVSQMAVGLDNVDLRECIERGISVGYTPDVLTETTADTAFALLSAAARRLPEGAAHVKDGLWGPWDPNLLVGRDIHETTVGIVGLGRIGSAVARRANGFNMRVIYTGSRKPAAEETLGAVFRSFEELLAESDHVVVTAPLNASTYRLIDARSLAMMRNDATLVNVSRGGLVDTDALYKALKEGTIGRAALDVTDPEPLPKDHPLLGLPNCLVTPHLGSASDRARKRTALLALNNLIAGVRGETLPASALA